VPLLIGYAFDSAIPDRRVDQLLWIGLALFGLQLLNSACALITRHVTLRVTKRVTARFRHEAVIRLLAAPRSYHTEHDAADLQDIVVHETERVDVMSNMLLGLVMPAIVLCLGIAAVLVSLNWMLFLAMFSVVPLNVLAGRTLGRRVRQQIKRFHETFELFSQGMLFLVRAIDLTRIQAAEPYEVARQGRRIEDLREGSGAMSWFGTLYSVAQQTLVAMAAVIVLVGGGALVAADMMTVGALLSFFAGMMMMRNPLHNVMTGMPRVMEGTESLRHVLEFLDGDAREPYRGTRRMAFSGRISLRDVSFAYGSTPVLSSISFDVAPGEIVAIIGRNGSGKSTIVNLILGFYRPGHGTLLADGVPYDELQMTSLRRSIAVVTQDPMLVPGTVRDNLTYGVPDATHDDVEWAGRIVGVDTLVNRYPQRYDTPVGEEGRTLSGGQRQRLSLGRALITRPRLLILDEPMNHLDEKDSADFLRRLAAAANHPAILLISHREDVSIAHRVFRLDEGTLTPVAAVSARPAAVAPASVTMPR
jgi:ABC-type multidrug transport system fused ATPase/permease subunit